MLGEFVRLVELGEEGAHFVGAHLGRPEAAAEARPELGAVEVAGHEALRHKGEYLPQGKRGSRLLLGCKCGS